MVIRIPAGKSGVRVPGGESVFLISICPDRLWGTPSHLFNRYWGLYSGASRSRPEADRSPLSSVEVKQTYDRRWTSTPPTRLDVTPKVLTVVIRAISVFGEASMPTLADTGDNTSEEPAASIFRVILSRRWQQILTTLGHRATKL